MTLETLLDLVALRCREAIDRTGCDRSRAVYPPHAVAAAAEAIGGLRGVLADYQAEEDARLASYYADANAAEDARLDASLEPVTF